MSNFSKRDKTREKASIVAAKNRRELIAAGMKRRDLLKMGLLTSARTRSYCERQPELGCVSVQDLATLRNSYVVGAAELAVAPDAAQQMFARHPVLQRRAGEPCCSAASARRNPQ